MKHIITALSIAGLAFMLWYGYNDLDAYDKTFAQGTAIAVVFFAVIVLCAANVGENLFTGNRRKK